VTSKMKLLMTTDAEAADRAQYNVIRGKDPIMRVASIEVDVVATNSAAQFIGGAANNAVDIGANVAVNRRPWTTTGGFPTSQFSQLSLVEGLDHTIDFRAGTWKAALHLDPADWDRPIIPTDTVGYTPMTVNVQDAVARATSEVIRMANGKSGEGFVAVSPEARKKFWLDRSRTAAIARTGLAFNAQGFDAVKEVSMAKAYCGELVNEVMYACVQFHGGMGFMKETGIERAYRDARILAIYEGTNEIQRQIIAEELLK